MIPIPTNTDFPSRPVFESRLWPLVRAYSKTEVCVKKVALGQYFPVHKGAITIYLR